MAQIVQLKRSALSGKVPDTGSLNLGELALNTYDGKIFFRRSGSTDTVQEVITTNTTNTGSVTIIGTLTATSLVGSISASNGVVSGSSQVISILTSLNTTSASLNSFTASHNAWSSSVATTGSNTFVGAQTFNSDITILGAVNARQFNIGIISSSIMYTSGSNKFGDTSDDTHQFTGSVQVTGSLYLNGVALGSTSTSNSGSFTGSFSGSFVGDGSGLRGVISDDIPRDGWDYNSNSSASISDFNVESDKYYIDFAQSQSTAVGTPVGFKGFLSNVSGSTQILPTLNSIDFIVRNNIVASIGVGGITATAPAGTVSGSSQLTSSYDVRYVLSGSITQTTWDNIASKPGEIVSGSSQIVGILSSLNTYTASVSTASLVTSISNLNNFTASQSTSSLVNRLNAIEGVSGSWITESETGSLATTGSNTFNGNETISGSLFINGTTEFGGDLIPKFPSGSTLGTQLRPFKGIFVSSGSINIASDIIGDPNTTLSNVGGNILVSAGGMRLVGAASFIATTGSFQYLSGSFTHIGAQFNNGDIVTTGSLQVSGSTIMIGDNTMQGNTLLSGSFGITGSTSFSELGNTSLLSFSSSLNSRINAATNEQSLGHLVTTSSFNSYTASISTGSLVSSITNLNNATSSYETQGRSIISSSAQITALRFVSSSVTASSIVSASSTTNVILFTKGDGSTLNVTVATGSATFVTSSFGTFHDTTTQSGSANTAYVMKLNSVDHQDGVILSGSGGMKVLQAGTYDIEFSAQLTNGSGDDVMDIWLRKNGTNVDSSNTRLVIKKDISMVAAWNWQDTANPNDVFEIMWSTTGGNMTISAFAESSSPTRPAIPSVIATIHRIDVGGGSNMISNTQFNPFTASINSFTSSAASRFSNLEAATSSYETIGRGIISSSAQLNGTTITNLTITNLTTVNETASVLFSSGSNRFGDFGDDIHSFTGSVKISGSITTIGSSTATSYNGTINATNGVVSGSSQVVSILSSLNTYTGSNDTTNTAQNARLTTIESVTGSYETKGRGIVSGSSQIDVMSTTNIAKLATTGSNTFNGNQIVTGSITTTSNVVIGGVITLPGSIHTSAQINFKNVGSETELFKFPASNNTITKYGATDKLYYKTDKAVSNQNILTMNTDGNVLLGTTTDNGAGKLQVAGNIVPEANGTRDLGSASYRWSTVYTSDLSLNNGIGDWTIVEGEDDLFLYNNKKGKVYKFALTEVDPSVATPKIS